jgi:hypothetical protein
MARAFFLCQLTVKGGGERKGEKRETEREVGVQKVR